MASWLLPREIGPRDPLFFRAPISAHAQWTRAREALIHPLAPLIILISTKCRGVAEMFIVF